MMKKNIKTIRKEERENQAFTTFLPVPLKYTYPIAMKTRLVDSLGKWNNNYFYPYTGKWLPRKNILVKHLKRKGLRLVDYYTRWYLRMSEDLIGTEIWADKMIETFYKDKLPDTQRYIKERLLENPEYECDFLMTKHDFLMMFYESRVKNNKPILKYDFSKVPEFIKAGRFLIHIIFLEINPKTGKPRGDYFTTYDHFIGECRDAGYTDQRRDLTKFYFKKFLRTALKLYKYKYGYDQVIYTSIEDPVKIFDKERGEYFFQEPIQHLEGMTPNKYISEQKSAIDWEKNKNMIYDLYFNQRKTMKEIGEILGISSTVVGKRIKNWGWRDPNVDKYRYRTTSSFGESLVEFSLYKLKLIDFKSQVLVTNIAENKIYLDFVLVYNKKTYIIEYNGRQHYEHVKFFHKTREDFIRQLKRDENIRNYYRDKDDYCYIEIPYIIDNRKDMNDFLTKTIIEGIDPNTLIDYKKLYKT